MDHLESLSEQEQKVYKILSGEVINVAKMKHPERDYSEMERMLNS